MMLPVRFRFGLLSRRVLLNSSSRHYSNGLSFKTAKISTKTPLTLRRSFGSFEQAKFEALQEVLLSSAQGVLFKSMERLISRLKARSKVNQDDLKNMTRDERKMREEEAKRDEILQEDLKHFQRRARLALAEANYDHTIEAENCERFQVLMESLCEENRTRGVHVLTLFFGYPPLVAEKEYERLQQVYSELDEQTKEAFHEGLLAISTSQGSQKSSRNLQTIGRIGELAAIDAITPIEEEEAKKIQHRMRGHDHMPETLRRGDTNFREEKAKEFKEKVEAPIPMEERASDMYSELVYDENSTPELKRWFREHVTATLPHEDTSSDFWTLRKELKQLLESSKTSNDPNLIQFVNDNELEELLRTTDERGEQSMENMERMVAFISALSSSPNPETH